VHCGRRRPLYLGIDHYIHGPRIQLQLAFLIADAGFLVAAVTAAMPVAKSTTEQDI